MESPTDTPDMTFPAADAEGELNPGQNVNYEVDPVSSQVATSLEIKKQVEAADREATMREKEKKDAIRTLKKTVIVSGIIVALAAAAFAISRKMKEK